MKLLFFTIIIIFLSQSGFIFGQDSGEKNSKNTTLEQTKAKLSIKDKIKKFNKKRLFEAEYDRFEDRTTVTLTEYLKSEIFNLSDIFDKSPTEVYGIYFTAKFSFKGQELQSDIKHIVLRFSAISRDWRWSSDRDLIAIVDGERIKFGDGTRASTVRKGGSVAESLSWSVPMETFEQIGNGKSVEVRIGSDELALNPVQIRRLKDFASLAEPD